MVEAWIVRTDYRGRDHEWLVDVEYKVTPGTPARLYGDYPHPEEPAEVEVLSVKYNGHDFDCSDDEWERCYDAACEDAPSAVAEWRACYDDYLYENARERAALEAE